MRRNSNNLLSDNVRNVVDCFFSLIKRIDPNTLIKEAGKILTVGCATTIACGACGVAIEAIHSDANIDCECTNDGFRVNVSHGSRTGIDAEEKSAGKKKTRNKLKE